MTHSTSRECDVLIAGAGTAGVPSAVAAARQGARTVLVERGPFPGGIGVTALHRYICGLYLSGAEEPGETLNPGLPREVVAGLCELSPSSHPIKLGRVWGFPFERAHLATVYSRLVRNEPNLSIISSASVESVRCDRNRITRITVRTADSVIGFAPSAVVDCTGAGMLIRLSGAPFELAPDGERQSDALILHLDEIEGDRHLLGVKIAWHLSREPADGRPVFAGFTPGPRERDGFCKFSILPAVARDLNRCPDNYIARIHTILTARVPELNRSRLIGHSGIVEREGVRLAGAWELDETSILQARKFSDGVVRNAWPIEFWDACGPPRYEYVPGGECYEIPLRCLQSRAIQNLFAAGRCISATSKALASTRVMGTCIALGEAAGKEAASFVKSAPEILAPE